MGSLQSIRRYCPKWLCRSRSGRRSGRRGGCRCRQSAGRVWNDGGRGCLVRHLQHQAWGVALHSDRHFGVAVGLQDYGAHHAQQVVAAVGTARFIRVRRTGGFQQLLALGNVIEVKCAVGLKHRSAQGGLGIGILQQDGAGVDCVVVGLGHHAA